MTRAQLKIQAKSQISGKIGILFVCLLLVVVIVGVLSVIPIIGQIGAIIITPALELGLIMIFLGLAKGKDVTITDLFAGFFNTVKAVLLTLWMGLFIWLWSLLFVIPGIVKSFSYSMAFYVLAENPDISVREALNESKRMMNGHKMDLFILMLSFIGWYLLGAITFGIAYIYVIPYMSATMANFYNSIKPVKEVIVEATEAPQIEQ